MTEQEQFALEVWQKNHPDPWKHKFLEADTCPFRHYLSMAIYRLLGKEKKAEREERRFWEERHKHGSGRDCKGACDREIAEATIVVKGRK